MPATLLSVVQGEARSSSQVMQRRTRTHFLYRIDMWSIDRGQVIEHLLLAAVEDFQVAMATYRRLASAGQEWITLSQGARVIESPVRVRQEA